MRTSPPRVKRLRAVYAVAAVIFAPSCLRAPAVHARALENNGFCAQYIAASQLDRAETHCDLGLEFSPEYADLWVNKGLIALKRNQIDVAKECFIKAIRFNQEQAQAYNNLGYVYIKQKRFGQAHDQLQRALKVNPDYLEARYNLALTLKSMQKRDEARMQYRTILAVNPNIADVYLDLGIMSFDERDYEAAVKELGRAVELSPQYVDAWAALGVAYTELGKYQEAKEAYVSCLQWDPDNIPCRQNSAIVNRKQALLDQTLKESQDPSRAEQTPEASYQLALQFKQKGMKVEEERTYKKCLKLDPKHAICHFGLFTMYRENPADKDATIACRNFLKFADVTEHPHEVETCEKFVSTSSF
jgi:tetratricopeptide (TPR) repeat protein